MPLDKVISEISSDNISSSAWKQIKQWYIEQLKPQDNNARKYMTTITDNWHYCTVDTFTGDQS